MSWQRLPAPGSPVAHYVRRARNVRILRSNLRFVQNAGVGTATRALRQTILSYAPRRSIALYLGLLLCTVGISATPLLADASQEPPKTGDLGFWEELAFWETIKDSRDPNEFQAYLAAYPAGRFARLAEIRIKALTERPASDSAAEPPQIPADEGRSSAGVSAGTSPETPTDAAAPTPAGTFRDCDLCPLMAEIPAGTYLMGSAVGRADEQPRHEVRFAKPFAIGVHEITIAEWDVCLREGGCRFSPEAGTDAELPVGNLSWDDAQAYVGWLSKKTGQDYRLPTEAEWDG